MTALSTYLVSLIGIHLAWAYFYVCGTLVRAPRPESAVGVRGAALVEIVVTSACGMAITGFVTFLLGLAHLLYPIVIVVWLAVLAGLFARRADAPWRPAFWRARTAVWHAAVSPGVLLLYALALFYGFASVRPDLSSDATSYHLVYPLEWAQAHGIFTDMSLRVPFYATNWGLLDLWLLMFRRVDQTQTLSWLSGLLSLFGIFGYVSALVERERGRLERLHAVLALLPALALGGSVVFLYAADSALIDVPMGYFFLVCALLLADAVRTRRRESVAALVLCAGFFMGMKISLILFYPVFAAAVAFVALLGGAARRRVGLTVLALTVLAAPWYARNFVLAGDPVAPALNITLRGVDPHWSAEDYHGLNLDLHAGEPTSAVGRLLVPLASLTQASTPAFRANGGTLMILLLWLPAALAAAALYRRGRVEPLEPYALAGLVAYGVGYWLVTSIQSRYALVFLPALAALLGELGARTALRAPAFRWAAAAVLLLCAIPTAQNAASAGAIVTDYKDLWQHFRDRESWLRPRAPTYPEVESISAALRSSGRTDLRVYRAYLEFDRLYFTERGIKVAGDLFGPERYSDFQQAIYADEMGPYVERFHIGAVLVPKKFPDFPADQQQRLREELTALGFRGASVSGDYDVYLSPEVR